MSVGHLTIDNGVTSIIPARRNGNETDASRHAAWDLSAWAPYLGHVLNDYVIHETMLARCWPTDNFEPLLYMHSATALRRAPVNSSQRSTTSAAREHYERIEDQLKLLLTDGDGEDVEVEQGAVETAQLVIRQLREHEYTPPDISWHGGDAVVMLWAIGSTTYAITVTDGELGYVVRQDRKAVRMTHSIPVQTFRLEDLT